MVGQDSWACVLIGDGSMTGSPKPSDVLLRVASQICWFRLRNELKASVSPSGEILAQPSIDDEFTSVDDPGSDSTSDSPDQPPKGGIARAAAAESAKRLAPSALDVILFMTCLAQLR